LRAVGLGNGFLNALLDSDIEHSRAASILSDKSNQDAMDSLIKSAPTPEDLDLLEELDAGGIMPDELDHLGTLAKKGVNVDEVATVASLEDAGAPMDTIRQAVSETGDPFSGGTTQLPYQTELEQAFGEDFSDVGVHMGQAASLTGLAASAASDGQSVSFATANPSKEEVAHELTHVVQQRRNGRSGAGVSNADSAGEKEAEQTAKAAAAGQSVDVTQSNPGDISRGFLDSVGSFFSGAAKGGRDFFVGAYEGGRDMVTGLGSMVVGANKLINPAVWIFAPEETAKTWNHLKSTVTTVVSKPSVLWDAFKKPFVDDWTSGHPGKAFGRGFFELVSLVIGTKGLDKLGKGSKVSQVGTKLDDIANVGTKVDDIANVGTKVDDIGKAGTKVDDIGKAGTKADDIAKASDNSTSAATRQHVHEGGTVTSAQSPYYGKWDGSGIHSWDGLVSRVKKDGYRIKMIKTDPKTGVRRVEIQKIGVHPKTKQPVTGTIKKTIYPTKYSKAVIDEMGESVFQQARKGANGTKFDPPGAGGKVKKDGTLVDGYFEGTAKGPDGAEISIQGWYKDTPNGGHEITSHAPKFSKDWPETSKANW